MHLWSSLLIVPAIVAGSAARPTPPVDVAAWQRQAIRDRQEMAADPQRPVYHFLPPKNWMNDPNGLIQYKGEYHLFYQHNPSGPKWGNMTWGHAVSRDLVHWTDLPYALSPDKPYDQEGVFSGCMVNDHGTPTAVYTGVEPEVQCIATSQDMITWEKPDVNPVIPGPPANLTVVGFRDPYVWRDGSNWYAVVGTGIKDVGGAILLYRSSDLRHWDYMGPALTGDKGKTGDMWECPNIFPLGDKWVLMVSTLGESYHFIGAFNGKTFQPESEGVTDYGHVAYAPQFFRDDKGRRIMFAWLPERRGDADKYGWQGVQSLPRVITLGPDGRLRYAPAEEVKKLRGQRTRLRDITVAPGGSGYLPGVRGDALEIDAKLLPGDAARTGLLVRRSPDGAEQTRIAYDPKAQTLSVDLSHASTDPSTAKETWTAPLALASDEPLDLRVFLDHSVMEVFANGKACLTSRIYPTRADSLGVDAFSEGGTAKLARLDAWPMQAIWPVQKAER